jgi:hypothetical protein
MAPDGTEGMIRRQCTKDFKILPIERKVRELLGLKKHQRFRGDGPVVEQWYGISLDEVSRMRYHPHKWGVHYYPLIEMKWERKDCIYWLEKRNLHPVRSACWMCPYRTNEEWRWLQKNSPVDWEKAVDFDRRIRKAGGMRGDTYLHRQCIPLEEVDLSTPEDHGQLGLWGDVCEEGMCGV